MSSIDGKEIDLFSHIPENINLGKFTVSMILTRKAEHNSPDRFNKLAQKNFKFNTSNQRMNFPRFWRAPDDFAKEGLSQKTIWFLKWIGDDLDKPIDELVVLWLNNSYKIQLQSLGANNNKKFQAQMTSAILVDIMFPILNRAVDENLEDAIAFQTMFKIVEKKFINDFEDLRSFKNRVDFHSVVTSWCQILVGLEKILEEYDAK